QNGSHEVIYLTSEQRGHRRGVAAKRYQGGFHAQRRVEHERIAERHRPDAGMRHIQLLGVRFHVADEFDYCFCWKFLPCGDKERMLHDHANRLEIGIRFVGEIRIKRYRDRVSSHMAHLDRVAIRPAAHGAERTDRTTGANDVLYDELLTERARHMFAYDP